MNREKERTTEIKKAAREAGASIVGVGRVGDLLEGFGLLSPQAKEGLVHGISLGVRLSRRILTEIEDHPTKLYFYHYRRLNHALDQLALELTNRLQEDGYNALPIPASQTVDWEGQRGHLSHKVIALRAGLGWLGRNCLLVHPTYGAQVRYVTVLTDAPLAVDSPLEGAGCGSCEACVQVCPVQAIGSDWRQYEKGRCLEKLKEFSKRYSIGHYICGLCVKACPGPARNTR